MDDGGTAVVGRRCCSFSWYIATVKDCRVPTCTVAPCTLVGHTTLFFTVLGTLFRAGYFSAYKMQWRRAKSGMMGFVQRINPR